MNIYRDGRAIDVTVPYQDENGNQVDPTAVSYRVLDGAQNELVASTPGNFTVGDTALTVTVDATVNALTAGNVREMRVVEVTMTTAAGDLTVFSRYVIESSTVLVVGLNTFQTYNTALLNQLDMLELEAWEAATERQRKAALVEAYHAISKLTFEVEYGQDRLFHGSTVISLTELDATQIAALPERFLVALRKGQLAEANDRLGGNPVEDKREMGLMSETVGESSNMFRPGKPWVLPVSQATMNYLGEFALVTNKRIARS